MIKRFEFVNLIIIFQRKAEESLANSPEVLHVEKDLGYKYL